MVWDLPLLPKKQVVLASNNPGKIREFAALLADFSCEVIPQAALNVAEVAETGLTFIENALIKARHAALITGLPAMADDSGLVVPALLGAPGIYSARYAGSKASATDNIQKLLQQLKNTPDEKRHAIFHCALVWLQHAHDPMPLVCQGSWSGWLLREPKGHDGFGYDPIFYLRAEQKTAAELSLALKNKISHRGLAMQALLQQLTETLC